jgi:AsmA protein
MKKKNLRIAAIAAVVLVLLLAGGVFLLKSSIKPNMFKPQFAGAVQRLTGLTPTFGGDVTVKLFPTSLRFEDVTLDSGAGPEGQPLVYLAQLDVHAELSSLLSGELKVSAVSLDGLQLNILRDAEGNINFPRPPVKEVTADEEKVRVTTDTGETVTFVYRIAALRITEAGVLFLDEGTGARYDITNLTLDAEHITPDKDFPVAFSCSATSTRPDLQGDLAMQGSFRANPMQPFVGVRDYILKTTLRGKDLPVEETGATLEGAAGLDGANKLFTLEGLKITVHAIGGELPGERNLIITWPFLRLDQNAGTLEAEPLLIATDELAATVQLHAENLLQAPLLRCELDVPAFPLAKALKNEGLDVQLQAPDALGSVSLAALLEASEKAVEITKATLLLDQTTADLKARWDFASRQGTWSLHLDRLDLDRYLPKGGTQSPAQPDKAAAPEMPAARPLLPEPLHDVVITGSLGCDSLRAAKLNLGKVKVDTTLKQGRLTVTTSVAELYKGALQSTLTADLTKPAPPLAVKAKADNVQLEPLLKALTGEAKVSGTASLQADLTARGLEPEAIKRGLGGTLKARARNGAVLGYSLSLEALQSGKALDTGLTQYQSATVDATIDKGVARFQRLDVQAKPNKVSGGGWVNLVQETLNLQLKAHLLNLAAVPVSVTGSLHNPSVSVDASALVEGTVKSLLQAPGDAAESVGDVLKSPGKAGKDIKDSIGGFLKGLGD